MQYCLFLNGDFLDSTLVESQLQLEFGVVIKQFDGPPQRPGLNHIEGWTTGLHSRGERMTCRCDIWMYTFMRWKSSSFPALKYEKANTDEQDRVCANNKTLLSAWALKSLFELNSVCVGRRLECGWVRVGLCVLFVCLCVYVPTRPGRMRPSGRPDQSVAANNAKPDKSMGSNQEARTMIIT